MLTALRKSTLSAALRMGGYIGWYLTVMYICEQSLRFYRDDSMLASVNVTFLLFSVLSAAVITVILLLLDIEGILSDKILRWLPGVFMAESGIALSLANASTMTAFAAAAGVGSAFGALAIISHLLRVKVGQRLPAIALGIVFGGAVRLLAVLLIGVSPTKTSLMIAAVAIGIFAALTVHSHGYSTSDSPLVSLAEAEPRKMLGKIPYIYIVLFLFSAVFYFAHSHIEALAIDKIATAYSGYAAIASLGIIAAAAVGAFTVKLPLLPMFFVFGAGLSAAAAILAGLPYMTSAEAAMFAAVSYAALACVKIGFYILIVIFSLDRPHPLFYAFLGYTAVSFGELSGRLIDRSADSDSLGLCVFLLVLLMPLGGGFIAHFMKRAGFTQNQLDHRHNAHTLIRRRAAELGLTDRELTMVEHIVLDGCDTEELANKMFFSRNTIRMLLRALLPKFKVNDLDELRLYFDRLTEDEERFIAEVQAAEEELRAGLAQRRREEKAEKAAAKEREFAELAAGIPQAEIILGGDDEDEMLLNSRADDDARQDAEISADDEAVGQADEAETEATDDNSDAGDSDISDDDNSDDNAGENASLPSAEHVTDEAAEDSIDGADSDDSADDDADNYDDSEQSIGDYNDTEYIGNDDDIPDDDADYDDETYGEFDSSDDDYSDDDDTEEDSDYAEADTWDTDRSYGTDEDDSDSSDQADDDDFFSDYAQDNEDNEK